VTNPIARLDPYELRQLPAHLVTARRFEDLHRLLRLDFAVGESKANAWFSAKDAAGELASYLEDVQLARRSEVERDSRDASADVAYLLMESSAGTMTLQLPDALVVALVERDLWTAEQGLAHAQRLPAETPGERWQHQLLRATLVEHLRADARPSAVEELRGELRPAELGEIRLSELLWKLVSAAPEPMRQALVGEALQVTRRALQRSRNTAVTTLATVIPRIPLPLRRDLWPDFAKAFPALPPEVQEVIHEFAPILTVTEVEQALALTSTMPRIGAQGLAVASLAVYLPEERRVTIAERELADVTFRKRTVSDQWPERLVALVSRLTARLADAALDAARKSSRPELSLSALAEALDAGDPRRVAIVEQVLSSSREYGNELWHARLVARLTRVLPEGERRTLWREAFATVEGISDEQSRLTALQWIAPYLDTTAVPAFVDLTRGVQWLWSRAEVLSLAAAALPVPERTGLLREVLESTRAAESASDVAGMIEVIAHLLPAELHDESLDCLERIADPARRRDGVAALAPHLDRDRLRRALGVMRLIGDGVDATSALLALASVVGSYARRRVREDAAAIAERIRDAAARGEAFVHLARASQEPLRTGFLANAQRAAREIASPYDRFDVLVGLAPELDGGERDAVLGQALTALERHDVGGDLDAELGRLAELLPPPLLDAALAFARRVTRSYSPHLIGAVVPFLPDDLRRQASYEALRGAGYFENAGDTHKLILTLAPHLPPEAMQYATNVAEGIDDETYRLDALRTLAEPTRTVQVERAVESPTTLTALTAAVDESVRLVGSVSDTDIPSALAQLAPAAAALEPGARLTLVLRVLRQLDPSPRARVFGTIASFVAPLLSARSAEAVATAIDETHSWWP
jgi:hypothetical protein